MKNVQLIFGLETYLIEEKVKEIVERVLGEIDDFNYAQYDMSEVEVEEAISDAETIPFMGGKRIVVLKDAKFLTGERGDKNKVEHNLDRYIQYIEDPNPDTTLIVVVPYEKLDGRKKAVKVTKKKADVTECKEMDYSSLQRWIKDQVSKEGVHISPPAIQQLIGLSGSNLTALVNEITKLSLHVGMNNEITEDVIMNLVARNLEQDVFLLIDRIVNRRIGEAHRILVDLLKQKEEPIKIVVLLARQFRLIYQVKELLKKGYAQSRMATELKVHPYPVKLAGDQGYRFESMDLLKIIDQLADLDFKMKTGQVDKVTGLEIFMAKLNV